MTTPTPRTDEYVGKQLQDAPEWVDASLARQLERAHAAALEESAKLRKALQKIDDTAKSFPYAGNTCGDIARAALRADFPKGDA